MGTAFQEALYLTPLHVKVTSAAAGPVLSEESEIFEVFPSSKKVFPKRLREIASRIIFPDPPCFSKIENALDCEKSAESKFIEYDPEKGERFSNLKDKIFISSRRKKPDF